MRPYNKTEMSQYIYTNPTQPNLCGVEHILQKMWPHCMMKKVADDNFYQCK